MTITTTYQPGNTVWFINNTTLSPVSGTIQTTQCNVDNALVQTKLHTIIIGSASFVVSDVHCFANQSALGTYYQTNS